MPPCTRRVAARNFVGSLRFVESLVIVWALMTLARPMEQLKPVTGLFAGLYSALVSPRRNPAGQITRAGPEPGRAGGKLGPRRLPRQARQPPHPEAMTWSTRHECPNLPWSLVPLPGTKSLAVRLLTPAKVIVVWS